jgi:peroxiredoxin
MGAVLLALRVLLVLVLAVAGLAKLADREGAREAVIGFGLPEALSGAAAWLLPLTELAAAVLLVASATARGGAALALVLMLIFVGAITRSLIRGEAPDCHCFGALHSEPAGPRTLIRNLALAAVAAVVLGGGSGTSATHWIAGLSGSGITILLLGLALGAALAGGAAFMLRLLRRNGDLLLRIDMLEEALSSRGLPIPSVQRIPTQGLPIGDPAPAFTLPDLDGKRVSLSSLRRRADQLMLVFTDPDCGPCSALMPQLAAWQHERPGGLRTVLISRGTAEANLAHAEEHDLTDILLQSDREVSESFASQATPSAVLVNHDGTVASAVHTGEEQIRDLVRSAGGQAVALPVHHAAPEPLTGRPAPDPQVRTLAGERVRLLDQLPSGEAIVVFWNPGCGFCQRMLESLRALDGDPHHGTPALAVVSTGDPESNRAMGLRAPVLLDDAFAAGAAFGASGTPSAVLVDAERRIASAVAVGADAVLALAGARPPIAA